MNFQSRGVKTGGNVHLRYYQYYECLNTPLGWEKMPKLSSFPHVLDGGVK